MVTGFKVSTEINWSALGTSDNFNWDVIFTSAFINVSENSLKGVRHLSGN